MAGHDYIDGVTVKVKDQYCHEDIALPEPPPPPLRHYHNYDFGLEQKTIALLDRWKLRRKTLADRINQLREDTLAKSTERAAALARMDLAAVSYPDDTDDTDETPDTDDDDDRREEHRDPAILRPEVVGEPRIPIKYQHHKMRHPPDLTRLSVSDFDWDTSSPFDNMELKTINDMEVLAEVLESDRPSAPSPPPPPPAIPVPVPMMSDYFNPYSNLNPIPDEPKPDPIVSDILRELEEEVAARRHARVAVPPPADAFVSAIPADDSPTRVPEPIAEKLDNPYRLLPPALQTTCERITSMGFPLDRVARACEELGQDNKKIVDYLLMMGQMMDLGFPESRVAKALIDNNFNGDKALDQLIS